MNNKEIYIKLEKAVGDNNVQEVSNILDQHSDLDLNDENLYTLHPPLCRAAKKGFYEICKTLIQYGADVNCIKDRLFSPLWGASSGNHLELDKERGWVSCINKFVLDKNKIQEQTIFRLPNVNCRYTFYGEEFKNLVLKHHLQGIHFDRYETIIIK